MCVIYILNIFKDTIISNKFKRLVMIVAIINEKGGSGKTTLAINLACKLINEGESVLFIDSDPQKSGEVFVEIRKGEGLAQGFKYMSERENLIPLLRSSVDKFDSIVIDTGGRDNKEMRKALSVADMVLIPVYPSQYDLSALNNMLNLVKMTKRANNPESKCFIIINRAFTNASLKSKINEFKEIIKTKEKSGIALLDSILYDREAFRMATMQGLGITEMSTPKNKAKNEFNTMFKELLNKYQNG